MRNFKAPFVKQCPQCEAPLAEWECDETGTMVVHLGELHECRLIDLSLGKPPREHLSDWWSEPTRTWVVRGHRLKE
jgi:hypothetical protein